MYIYIYRYFYIYTYNNNIYITILYSTTRGELYVVGGSALHRFLPLIVRCPSNRKLLLVFGGCGRRCTHASHSLALGIACSRSSSCGSASLSASANQTFGSVLPNPPLVSSVSRWTAPTVRVQEEINGGDIWGKTKGDRGCHIWGMWVIL